MFVSASFGAFFENAKIFAVKRKNICGKTYPVLPQIRVRICGNKFTKYRKYFQELAVNIAKRRFI